MKNNKGYSVIELLVTLVVIVLIVIVIIPPFLKEIDAAKGRTILMDARSVYIASQGISTEAYANNIPDRDIEAGLTGVALDYAYPNRANISEEINRMLAPDIVLSKEPTETTVKATFVVKNGKVEKLTFEKMIGNKKSTAIVENGETKVTYEKVESK